MKALCKKQILGHDGLKSLLRILGQASGSSRVLCGWQPSHRLKVAMGPVLSQGAQTFVPGEVTLGTTVLQTPDGGGSNHAVVSIT